MIVRHIISTGNTGRRTVLNVIMVDSSRIVLNVIMVGSSWIALDVITVASSRRR